jgi:mannose-6-phosphate isomerase-like protein (cupin superfamily)
LPSYSPPSNLIPMYKLKITLLASFILAVMVLVTTAQPNPSAGVVTVFDHQQLDASFNKAFANGGSSLLWSRASSKGTYNVDTHSRESVQSACKPEGCSHKDYTAVVYVVSGSATMLVGGKTKAAAPDKFGGNLIQGGESRRISQGDVFIMPPDTIHWYKDVTAPFRYLEVPVP